ncbi:MFS transporter [Fictibacillus aquaticus]|uniref:MFS transporter n=1 Tax=Fictibacillus aquaticus TaxID=2021314 RepID=A0A235F751_9BACL|nr:MFS transporter [Fictibacillus aquaticus]OYD56787.1 MFS transporter [Fictibacillus aquaticus]
MQALIKGNNRSLYVLLFIVFAVHIGSYLILPIMPIYLKNETGLSVGQIGFTLGVTSVFMQAGSVSGGFLADRLGRRFIIGLGAVVRAAGLLGFVFFKQYELILMTAAVSGLGLGLNAPSTKAFISSIVAKENQSRAFSMRGIAANIGMALAGLIVFFFLTGKSALIFITAAVIFAATGIISWILLPSGCGGDPCPDITVKDYREVFRNKPFLVFAAATVLLWALYAQFALALPLRAEKVLHDPKSISIVWTVNSLTVILAQTFVTSRFITKVHPMTAMGLGAGVIGIALGALYYASAFPYFILIGMLFVFGEMMIMPTLDTVISQLAAARLLGIFFGMASVFNGIGEAGGNTIGGQLLVYPSLPYAVYAVFGFVILAVMLMLKRWSPMRSLFQPENTETSSPKTSTVTGHANPTGWLQSLFKKPRATK